MSEALVSQLARALNLPPAAARHTLDHLVATLREQLDAAGRAVVPGLGTFVRGESGLAFEPDDALARAVNHRYAGLRPIAAGAPDDEPEPEPAPESDDPFADTALTAPAVGFQPLDSIVETEAPEGPEVEAKTEHAEFIEESAPEPSDAFGEAETARPFPADDLLDEVDLGDGVTDETEAEDEFDAALSDAEPSESFVAEDAPDEETDTLEAAALPDAFDASEGEEPQADAWEATEAYEEDAPLSEVPLDDEFEPEAEHGAVDAAEVQFEPIAEFGGDEDVIGTEPGSPFDLDAADHDEGDEVAATDAVEFDDAEAEDADLAALLTAEPEDADAVVDAAAKEDEFDGGMLGNLNELTQPDEEEARSDEDLDEEEISAIIPVMAGEHVNAPDERPGEDAPEGAAAPAVAPAVAATSRDAAPAPSTPKRRSPVLPILITVGAVLGVVALLWFFGRGTDAPIAEQPTPADTTTIAAAPPPDTQPPADTAAVAMETPPESAVAPADPLRSSEDIDQAAGGFSWVVGSELSREPAERRVAEFRAQGLRAGVIAEQAAGRTRYRVALGQFESIEQAERFRSDLPAGVPADTWLLRF